MPRAALAVAASFVLAAIAIGPAARGQDVAPLDRIEVITGGAAEGARLPLLIALHGRGDDPARWSQHVESMVAAPARVLLLRAPMRLGNGFEWFRYAGEGAPVAPIGRQMAAAMPRLVATIDAAIRERPIAGRPIVTGFSQGAMMTYALAVRHPDRIAAAYPVAGFLVQRELRAIVDPARVPPIVAFHGTADRVIPIARDRRSVAALRARGVRIELREHPGIGHTLEGISPALMTEIRAELERQRAL